MLDKILVKELDQLRKKLTELNITIEETVGESQKKDKEYVSAKKANKKLLRSVFDVGNEQDIKLSNLEEKIEELEMKVGVLSDELAELEATSKDNALEVGKVKAEIKETKKTDEKIIAQMREELKEAQADLKEERNIEMELIRNQEELMKNAKKEFDTKLNEAKLLYEARFKKAENKYKAAEEPLLYKIQCLDSDIEAIETEISLKPKEMRALKLQNEALLRKLKKTRALK